MIEIQKHDGKNSYKLPHIRKGKLEQLGELPTVLTAQLDIVEETEEDNRQSNVMIKYSDSFAYCDVMIKYYDVFAYYNVMIKIGT